MLTLVMMVMMVIMRMIMIMMAMSSSLLPARNKVNLASFCSTDETFYGNQFHSLDVIVHMYRIDMLTLTLNLHCSSNKQVSALFFEAFLDGSDEYISFSV